MDQLACNFDTAKYLIFSSNVFAPLLYYSHFFALLPSLIIGLVIFSRDKKALINNILFIITIIFSLWIFFDLILWATEKQEYTMFFWSVIVLIEPLIYALCVYFVDVFITKQDISLKKKFGIFLLLLPIIVLLPTRLILTGFDFTNCDRAAIQGPISTYYVYAIEIIYIFWIIIFSFKEYFKSDHNIRKQILLITTGITFFLLSFSLGNILESFTDNWYIGQYGLFGAPIFVAFLAYMIVKFKIFNLKVIGTQVLVFVLGFLVFAILFIRKIGDVRIVVIFTLLFVIVLGYLLIKSVKREIQQKEELAKLNLELQEVMKQRENLVHLVTHKVKGSFTRSKYIFAGILDGTFGEVSPEIKKRAEQGLESDDMGIETVDLVLSVANMEKGLVKYDMQTVDFREIVLKSISDKTVSIETKGLKLENKIEQKDGQDGMYNVNGDVVWLKEAVNNLIENSIKYTKEGMITVGLEKKENKILLFVHDTGIGVTEEDKKNLFTEGGRGKDSVKVNVDSTGYGLYSVKLIIEAHKGRVWFTSEGLGKGSTFFIELNAI